MFPTNLPCMLYDRDRDSYVNLELRTRPFSISPYHMDLLELRELKAQIWIFKLK